MPNLPLIASPQGTLLEVLLSSSDISDITSIGSGQIITTAERTTLNSAIQPGNNISLLNNNVGYTTVEEAQDAIGNILTDSSTIDFTYNDGVDTITADLNAVINDLNDVDTTTTAPILDDVLQWNGSSWVPTALPVFGQGAEDFANDTPVVFTTNVLTNLREFTTAVKSPGRYRVAATIDFEPGNNSQVTEAELRVNGVTISLLYAERGDNSPGTVKRKVPFIGYYEHLTTATFNIQIYMRNVTNGSSATLLEAVAETWRVS